MTEVEGEEKTQTAQITQSEDEVHQKRPLAEIGKDEEPTSVFTHVTLVENPWESMGNQRDSCYYLVKQCLQRVSPSVIL